MRHLPQFKYFGLTIVLNYPSRFDIKTKRLLSANGGHYFQNDCLMPFTNSMQCDVRTADDMSPLLPGTKAILLLGDKARDNWVTDAETKSLKINQLRGNPTTCDGIPVIVSYAPQDAVDMQNYEKDHNPFAYNTVDENETAVGPSEKSRSKGNTARSNFRFWLKADTRKAIRICLNGGVLPSLYERPAAFYINRPAEEICSVLLSAKDKDINLDVETTGNLDIRCFAFSIAERYALPSCVYGVTTICYNWTQRYSDYPRILRALAIACSRNRIIAHNGHRFDFPLLLAKYRIPFGKDLYDTLIAQHRFYPSVEKSLGHCVSYWLYERYHKDDGVFCPNNSMQEDLLVKYCCSDVWTTGLVCREQEKYAADRPGLRASLDQAMGSIRPYLIMSFAGIKVKVNKLQALVKENDRLMNQYLRVIRLLVGHEVLPTSSPSMVKYFHEELRYPVLSTSEKTGKPSLDKKVVYRLALKHPNNPVMKLALKYRALSTETGRLAKLTLARGVKL